MSDRRVKWIQKNIIKYLTSAKRKRRRKKILKFLLFALMFFIISAVPYRLVKRNNRQKSRVLIITDEIFYDTAIKFQENELIDKLKREGYALEIKKMSISLVSQIGTGDLRDYLSKLLNEKPTRLVLLSPIFTNYYDAIDFDNYKYDFIISKPIVIGIGNILSTTKFDRVYRLDNEAMYNDSQVFDYFSNYQTILLYNSNNLYSNAMHSKAFLKPEMQYDISSVKPSDLLNYLTGNSIFFLTYRLPDKIDVTDLDMRKMVVPYYLMFFFRNSSVHFVIHPDFLKMILDTIKDYNSSRMITNDVLSSQFSLKII